MVHSLERRSIGTLNNNTNSIWSGCVKIIGLGSTLMFERFSMFRTPYHHTTKIEQGIRLTVTTEQREGVLVNYMNKEKFCFTCIDPMHTYSASTSGTKSVPFKVFSDSRSISNSPCPSTNGILWRINNRQRLWQSIVVSKQGVSCLLLEIEQITHREKINPRSNTS